MEANPPKLPGIGLRVNEPENPHGYALMFAFGNCLLPFKSHHRIT